MFRFFLVTVALGLTVGQRRTKWAYTPNTEYMYDYETQIVTGIPKGSKIYSGLKFKATARLQFETTAKALLKFENVEFYKINDMIDGVDPTKQQVPEEYFVQLTGPEAKDMTEKLAMPLKFSYIRGHVSDLHGETNDPYWSMDIKRGFLSIMEVNLEERQSMDSGAKLVYQNRVMPGETEFYTVMEPSVAGECETFYSRLPGVTTSGDPSMHLYKIRNYNKCVDRPTFISALFNDLHCPECESKRTEPLRSSSEVRYFLKGVDRNFFIHNAIAESQHIFTPYTEEGGSVATFINQTLMWTSSKVISRPIPQPENPKRHYFGLRSQTVDMKDPLKEKNNQDSSQDNNQRCEPNACVSSEGGCTLSVEQENIKVKIQKLLTTLSAFTEHEIKEEATTILPMLLFEFRHAEYSVLAKFWSMYGKLSNTDPGMRRIRKILLDTLPAAGNHAAVFVLEHAIEAQEMTIEEASIALSTLAVYALPDICIAKRMQTILRFPMIATNRRPKISAWLCMGAVVDKINRKYTTEMLKTTKDKTLLQKLEQAEKAGPVKTELKQKISKLDSRLRQKSSLTSHLKEEFVEMLHTLLRADNEADKLLAIKTIRNSGFIELIPDLMNIINDKTKPYVLRSQAIFAFSKMLYVSPEPIRSILLPRFFDRTEVDPIRIAAYFMFVLTRPPRPMWQMAVQYLHEEANPNIGTFVYSLMEQFSNSTDPCMMEMAKNATVALRFARNFDPKYHYSRFLHNSWYNDKILMGLNLDLGVISSSKEFIPTAVAVGIRTHFLGRSIDMFEAGYNAEGIQTLLSNLMGPESLMKKGVHPFDILKRKQSGSMNEQPEPEPRQSVVHDIHEQLNVSPRHSPEPEGHIYFKFFGNEIQYMPFDRNFINGLLRQGKVQVPYNENDLRTGNNLKLYKSMVLSDMTYMLASESGFPLSLNVHGSTFCRIDGTFNLTGIPALFKANRPGQKVDTVKGSLDLIPSAVVALESKMLIDAFYYKSGAAVKSTVQAGTPLSFTYGYDIVNNKVFTTFDMSRLKERFMKLEIKPFTFIRKEPFDLRQWPALPETKDIDIANDAVLNTVSTEYGNYECGVNFAMKGQMTSRNFLPTIPYFPFSGKQMLYFTATPGVNPPTAYEFQLTFHRENRDRVAPGESSDIQRTYYDTISEYASYLNPFSSYSGTGNPPPESEVDHNVAPDLPSVIDSFRDKVPIMDEWTKYAYTFKISGIGSNPLRYGNLDVLVQKSLDGHDNILGYMFKRSPYPQIESNPFQFDMNVRVTLPVHKIEPSYLFDPQYLDDIERQMNIHVQQDGKSQLVLRLKEKLPVKQDMLVGKLQSAQIVVDKLVQNMIQKNIETADPLLKKVTSMSVKLRKLEKEAKLLKQEMYHLKDVGNKELHYRHFLEKVSSAAGMLKQVLANVITSGTDPRVTILSKYCVLKQQKLVKHIWKVYTLMQDLIPVPTQQELQEKVESIGILLHQLVQQEIEIVLHEPVNVQGIPGEPRQDIKLKELKQKQESVLAHLVSPTRNPRLEDVSMPDVLELIRRAENVAAKLKEVITGKLRLQKSIEYELLQGVVLQLQVAEGLKTKIEHVKQEMKGREIPRQWLDVQQKLNEKKETVKKQTSKFCMILAQNMKNEQIWQLLQNIIPSPEQEKLQKLANIKLQQILVINDLKRAKYMKMNPQPRNQDDDQLPLLQSVMDQIKSVELQLADLIGRPQDLSSHLIMIMSNVLQTQVKLLEQFKEQVLLQSVSKSVWTGQTFRQLDKLKNDAEGMLVLHLSYLKKYLTPFDKYGVPILDDVHMLRSQTESSQQSIEQIPDQTISEPVSRIAQGKKLKKPLRFPHELYFQMALYVGPDDTRTKVLNIEMIGKKSLEQLLWEKDQIYPLQRDPMVQKYWNEMTNGVKEYTEPYRQVTNELNTLRHFHWSIEYKKSEVPTYMQLFVWRFRENFKYGMFPHMKQDFPCKAFKPNYMELIMDVLKNNRQMDMDMVMPDEVDRFHGMFIPFTLQYTLTMFQPYPYQNMLRPSDMKITKKIQSECKFKRNLLKTFDGHTNQMPDSKGCDVILAMDCSSSMKFAVKTKKLLTDPLKYAVIIHALGRKVEVTPDSETLIVKVDSIPQSPIPDNEPLVIFANTPEGSPKRVSFKIMKINTQIKVMVPAHGTDVTSDGGKISVKVSPYFYSKICGLCGDYDSNPSNDKKDPQKQIHNDPACLLASYALSNDQCNVEDVKAECVYPPATCSPMKKTEIKTKVNKICFSASPVYKCKPECRPIQKKLIRVPMICVDKTDPRAESLRRRSEQRPLTAQDLEGYTSSAPEHVLQHESCTPLN